MSTTRIDRTQETIAVDASRLQAMLMPDIMRLAADYVQGNNEQKDRIRKIAENTKEIYFPFVIENLKRAVSEDVEQAIYLHNPFKRKHDEKIDKAYKEYAGEVSFRFLDLSIFCAFQAIAETKRVPSYRRAVDKALKIAERLVKELKDETACQAETAYHLTFPLITFTCTNLYDIYHFDEMKKHHELLRDNAEKALDILDRLKHETDEQKREAYYKQMDELDQALNDAAEQYYSKVYRYNEVEQIAAAIVSRLYPNADKIKEILPSGEDLRQEIVQVKRTFYPSQFIMPTTKVNNKLFEGALAAEAVNLIATEKKGSKKELTVKVSIDFDQLEGVRFSRELEPFDRIVHDAVASLYEAGNEFITPLMIYRAMTGNPRADLTEKRFHEIAQSLNKLSAIRISIDANGEAKAYGMDKVTFKGNLLYTKSVYVEHNGQVNEWFKVLERPILLEYAEQKRQIDRVDIKMLNTPVNKNEETIILQDYLLRRIRAMKKSNVSRNILYETVYKQLGADRLEGVEARKKKAKIREATKKILDFWKDNGEIRGYKENTGKNNAILSLTIILD